MYFELYDSKGNLLIIKKVFYIINEGILHFCQGDDKIYSGSHSICKISKLYRFYQKYISHFD